MESDSVKEESQYRGAFLRLLLQKVEIQFLQDLQKCRECLSGLSMGDQKAGELSTGCYCPLLEGLSPGVIS